MAVFRAALFQPDTAKAHEIAEAPRCRIPGMLDEGDEPRRQHFAKRLFAGGIEGAGQQKRASIVVYAIAVRPVRNGMYGVLEKTGIVTHRQQMADLHVR